MKGGMRYHSRKLVVRGKKVNSSKRRLKGETGKKDSTEGGGGGVLRLYVGGQKVKGEGGGCKTKGKNQTKGQLGEKERGKKGCDHSFGGRKGPRSRREKR